MSEQSYEKEKVFTVIGFYEQSLQRYADSYTAEDAMEAQIQAMTHTRLDTGDADRVIPVAVTNVMGVIVDSETHIDVGDLQTFDGIVVDLQQQAMSIFEHLSNPARQVVNFLNELGVLRGISDTEMFDCEDVDPDEEEIAVKTVDGRKADQALLLLAQEVRDYNGHNSTADSARAMIGFLHIAGDRLGLIPQFSVETEAA